ncbi:nucleotidyltransferase domain-containing protein [Nocardioides bruguierae]|uniref:Nucleotidyltransferase domain-containing protein n=1 Tax=Nocardioides bruguierae TaxID=2945102 RepID=A0A9X2D9Y3_9ACTN|nr:nucleotidyltransferase domain-containing protein [Nocardioides bruguierae]MCM0621769.1 nucleotidyltransferase domain-containing protein [Nocardioides bruguierae]
MTALAELARRTDAAVQRARAELVTGVRAAHASGLTQAEIAREIGRSQPEVSRLLHFHGRSARGRALRRNKPAVLALISEIGGGRVRVFGSVATGTDGPDSDIDLLIDLSDDVGMLRIARTERLLADILGYSVDLVSSSDLRADLRDRVLAEAVPL